MCGKTAYSIVIALLLAACTSGNGAIEPPFQNPQAPPPHVLTGHVFVADAAGVQRFPMFNGVPASAPDLTFTGFSGPIAVDTANNLYAVRRAFQSTAISQFPPNSTTSSRTVQLPTADFGEGTAKGLRSLAVDAGGRIYAEIVRGVCIGSVGCGPVVYSESVLIFGPNATGTAAPLTSFSVSPFSISGNSGIAIDSQGDVLVSTSNDSGANVVESIGSPLTQPTVVRAISGSGVPNATGLVVDTTGEIYLDGTSPTAFSIFAFPSTANGNVAPDRQITIAGAKSFGSGIAASGGFLFVPDPLGNAVFKVSATQGGMVTPVATLTVPSPTDTAVGM